MLILEIWFQENIYLKFYIYVEYFRVIIIFNNFYTYIYIYIYSKFAKLQINILRKESRKNFLI